MTDEEKRQGITCSAQFNIRVTPQRSEEIRQGAKAAGLLLGEYLREAVNLGCEVIKAKEQPAEEVLISEDEVEEKEVGLSVHRTSAMDIRVRVKGRSLPGDGELVKKVEDFFDEEISCEYNKECRRFKDYNEWLYVGLESFGEKVFNMGEAEAAGEEAGPDYTLSLEDGELDLIEIG